MDGAALPSQARGALFLHGALSGVSRLPSGAAALHRLDSKDAAVPLAGYATP